MDPVLGFRVKLLLHMMAGFLSKQLVEHKNPFHDQRLALWLICISQPAVNTWSQ